MLNIFYRKTVVSGGDYYISFNTASNSEKYVIFAVITGIKRKGIAIIVESAHSAYFIYEIVLLEIKLFTNKAMSASGTGVGEITVFRTSRLGDRFYVIVNMRNQFFIFIVVVFAFVIVVWVVVLTVGIVE